VNVTVVIGVNNTIYIVNQDMQDNLGHVIQSVNWPTGAQPFGAFDLLPGWVAAFTLTTPGVYHYQCTWHPIWMEGTITVLAHP
jgi:plastocyanin